MSRRLFRSAPTKRRLAARSSVDTRATAAGAARISRWIGLHVLPALGILVALLVLVFVGILLFGSQFKVRQVEVVGADLIDAQALRESAAVSGRSILTINPGKVEDKLSQEYIILQEVTVGREMPDKVIIRIKEQQARWAWESAGRYWWLRTNGTVIGEMPDAGKLPVIHDVAGVFSEPSKYIAGVPWKLAEAMLQALPVIPAFDYTVNEGLIVYVTDKQWPVYLGTQGDAGLKAVILRELVEELTERQAQVAYIDLRNEARPMYKKQA